MFMVYIIQSIAYICDLIGPDYNSSKLIILDTDHSRFLAKHYDHLN